MEVIVNAAFLSLVLISIGTGFVYAGLAAGLCPRRYPAIICLSHPLG